MKLWAVFLLLGYDIALVDLFTYIWYSVIK